MATGFKAKGDCFATQAEAVDNYWMNQPPEGISSSTLNVFFQVHHLSSNGTVSRIVDRCTQATTSIVCTRSTSAGPVISTTSCTLADLPSQIDYTVLGAVWVFMLSVVVTMFILGRGAGLILSIFRGRGH
jgi:hypothetical protein